VLTISALLVASIVALGVVSDQKKWVNFEDYSGTKHWGDSGTYVYVKPYFRAPPYLIGMLAAIFWLTQRPRISMWYNRQQRMGVKATVVGVRGWSIETLFSLYLALRVSY
jgi:hypothetical protein